MNYHVAFVLAIAGITLMVIGLKSIVKAIKRIKK